MKPIIVIGGGGHSSVVINSLFEAGFDVLGYTDFNRSGTIERAKYLGNDEIITDYSPSDISLCIGIGSIQATEVRKNLFQKWKSKSYNFVTLIHPTALISKNVQFGEGTQVLLGATVQTGAKVAENCILNTRCIVEHDCEIESHTHISPGCLLLGSVHVNACSHVGAGAIILQGLIVGKNATVGAGAVVTKNVCDFKVVYGVPAKEIKGTPVKDREDK